MKLHDIFEAETKSKDKTGFSPNFGTSYQSPAKADSRTKTPTHKQADTKTKKQKIRNIQPIDNAPAIHDIDFDDEDFADDEENLDPNYDFEFDDDDEFTSGWANDDQTVTDNLPATVSRDVATRGPRDHGSDVSDEFATTTPEWLKVRDLPGYMQQGIRMMGRKVFKQFTSLPLERMEILSTLTNREEELNAVAKYLRDNGTRLDSSNLEFHNIEGYDADTQLWTAGSGDKARDYLLVKDFAGNYIYSWPSSTRIK